MSVDLKKEDVSNVRKRPHLNLQLFLASKIEILIASITLKLNTGYRIFGTYIHNFGVGNF